MLMRVLPMVLPSWLVCFQARPLQTIKSKTNKWKRRTKIKVADGRLLRSLKSRKLSLNIRQLNLSLKPYQFKFYLPSPKL